jgi:hypothetical protein
MWFFDSPTTEEINNLLVNPILVTYDDFKSHYFFDKLQS